MPESLERAIHELALGPPLDPANDEAVRRWLHRNGVEPDDAEAISAMGIERLLVYRRLVRANLHAALEGAIPRVMGRLGDVFDEYFVQFLAERGPRSHFLRDVPAELLAFCEPLWRSDPRVPRYIVDLARYERARIEIHAIDAGTHEEVRQIRLDAGVRFRAPSQLLHLEWSVHRLPDAADDRTPATPAAARLVVYRDDTHDVRWLELTPMAASIVGELMGGATVRAALETASASHGVALDPATLQAAAELMALLGERGVILGGV